MALTKPATNGITHKGEDLEVVLDGMVEASEHNPALVLHHMKRVVASYPWVFPDYNFLLSTYGYTQLVPQGVAVCENYIYNLYYPTSTTAVNKWSWVAVFDRQTSAYVSCFSLPTTSANSFPEGGFIRMVGATKVLYTEVDNAIRGWNVTTLPANKAMATEFGTAVIGSPQFQAFGACDEGIALTVNGTDNRGVAFYGWDGVRKGRMNLSPVVNTTGVDNANVYHTSKFKVQGRTVQDSIYYAMGGGQFRAGINTASPLFACNFLRAAMDGTTLLHTAYDPVKFIEKLTGVPNTTTVECEGATTTIDGKVYSQWYYEIQSPYSLNMLLIEEDSNHVDAVDLRDASIGFGASKNDPDLFVQSFNASNIQNPYTGATMTTLNDVCEMMRQAKIDRYSLYTSGAFYVHGTNNPLPNACMVNFYRTSIDTIFMQLTTPTFQRTITSTGSGAFTFNKFQVGGLDTDTWFGTGDFVVAGFSGLGVVATRRVGTADSIHYRFQNDNGVVGTINTSGSTTIYRTTSDERLKVRVGEYTGALELVDKIVDTGAISKAYFKNDHYDVRCMFMAQTLAKVFPEAVSLGEGKIGEPDFVPMGVDYSKITPYLVQAIHDLKKEVEALKGKA